MRRFALTIVVGLLAPAALARADGPHKQAAPVDMSSIVHGRPHAGQPLEIDVTVTPRIDVSSLHVSLVAAEGLSLDTPTAEQSFGHTAAHQARKLTLQVTPRTSGMQLLSVIAEIRGVENGATRRTNTIELLVDAGSAAQKGTGRKPSVTDATGQRIQSMRGVTR
jgi:hypothetical protein